MLITYDAVHYSDAVTLLLDHTGAMVAKVAPQLDLVVKYPTPRFHIHSS